MVMRFCFLLSFIISTASALADSTFVQPRLIRATATLAPGYTLKAPTTSFYLHGYLEYFPEQRISLRGDGMWFLKSSREYFITFPLSNMMCTQDFNPASLSANPGTMYLILK